MQPAAAEDTAPVEQEHKRARLEEQEPRRSHLADSVKQLVTCGICLDVFHNPVMCVPCTHTFCGGCLSKWSLGTKGCPLCREKIFFAIPASKNDANLAMSYLEEYPDERRDPEELAALSREDRFKKGRLFKITIHPRSPAAAPAEAPVEPAPVPVEPPAEPPVEPVPVPVAPRPAPAPARSAPRPRGPLVINPPIVAVEPLPNPPQGIAQIFVRVAPTTSPAVVKLYVGTDEVPSNHPINAAAIHAIANPGEEYPIPDQDLYGQSHRLLTVPIPMTDSIPNPLPGVGQLLMRITPTPDSVAILMYSGLFSLSAENAIQCEAIRILFPNGVE